MSLSELNNTPVEITINGRSYKLCRLSISEIWATAETHIKNNYIRAVQDIAAGLTGAEKMAYLRTAATDMPRGVALQDARADFISSAEGACRLLQMAIAKHTPITEAEVSQIILSDPETIEFAIRYVLGMDEAQPVNAPVNAPEADKKK